MTEEKPQAIFFLPALPSYRLDFFDRVARESVFGLRVHYPPAEMDVLTKWSGERAWARPTGAMRPLFPGAEWQSGVLSTPFRKGDIVVIHGAPRNISNMLMLVWARVGGARTIWWGHYWTSTSKTHRYLLRLLLMRLSHAVLFYTDQEVAEYRRRRGADTRPIAALNNGIDVKPIVALRDGYDARLRRPSILFLGRLTDKTDLATLLRALTDPRLSTATLEIVGGGSEGPHLQALAVELGVAKRIIWHPGTIDEANIAAVANRCRIFAYPGAVGLSLIHAMAYGLPAVVHGDRWRQMPEIAAFTDGDTGRAFKPGDVESLANVLFDVLNDFHSLNRWSKEAARRAETIYNTEVMAKRFDALVTKLIRPTQL